MADSSSSPSSATPDYLTLGFERIARDIEWLSDQLAGVLASLGETELAAWIPWQTPGRRPAPDPTSPPPARLGLAYAMSFQLLNCVEEQAAASMRQLREFSEGPEAEPGLWGHRLAALLRAGASPKEIRSILRRVEVEPVFTAHPTEAKRTSVLEQHRMLQLLLQQADGSVRARAEATPEVQAVLERLWRTGEILLAKPTVADERRNVINYFRDVLPGTIESLDRRLERAWTTAGLGAGDPLGTEDLPRLRFGTWVGGDRDGHPGVTAEVTRETLERLRANALVVMHRQLTALAERLPLSDWVQTPPAALLELRDRCTAAVGGPSNLPQLHPGEPWRQTVELMAARLPLEMVPGHPAQVRTGAGRYGKPAELDADLAALQQSLLEAGADRLAEHDVRPVRRVLATFGFHLARLDIRQNSAFHSRAMQQLLGASGLDASQWEEWSETERLRLLEREIRSPRPFLHPRASAGPEADAVLATYRVIVEHLDQHGPDGLGSLIVSMTRRLSDLLCVYVLAREAGLMRLLPEGMVCLLPVVPLLETADDLERGPEIVRAFLDLPVTRASLAFHAKRGGHAGQLRQQVMVGYSDSNKDAGIFASQWALQRCQTRLSALGHETGVSIQFFHGRGGTISRGAGPTHRFLDALPAGSLDGSIRLTEQGETIAQKYGHSDTARYHLELLLAGVTDTTLRHAGRASAIDGIEPLLDRLARTSHRTYRALLETEGFLQFHRQATPVDALENARIGSRPARRSGQATLADLRAIPWVFSWTQARYYLTGWYGVGAALETLTESEVDELRGRLRTVPFLHYLLTNVETSLASSDLEIMREYGSLVEDSDVRQRIWQQVESEWHRTHQQLVRLRGAEFARRRPRLSQTLERRAAPLVILHRQQIAVLRRWRELLRKDPAAAETLLPELLLTVNAIANGLRTTG